MARIVIASHSPTVTTGYGRVVRAFARSLIDAGHALRAVGAGYQGERNPQGYPIFPSGPNEFGRAMRDAIVGWSPQLLITAGDPWMFPEMPELRRSSGVPWLACFPIDSEPLPNEWTAWMRAADVAVVFSDYAARVVRAHANISPVVVPHGVDLSLFRPLDKDACKARVGVRGSFVVGTVAVNQARKNLPALIGAFAQFARGKADVLLYLHTQVVGHWDLERVLEQHGLGDRARATLNFDPLHGPDDRDLATIYNSFDAFALPTMAEGFGLPILESQACGVPTLATDCSSCTELLPHPLQRVPVRATKTLANGMTRSLIDEAALADRLERIYRDQALRDKLIAASLSFASRFQWNDVTRPLVDVVAGLTERAPR